MGVPVIVPAASSVKSMARALPPFVLYNVSEGLGSTWVCSDSD